MCAFFGVFFAGAVMFLNWQIGCIVVELLDVGEKRKKSVEYHDNELNVLQCQYKGNKAFSFKHLK